VKTGRGTRTTRRFLSNQEANVASPQLAPAAPADFERAAAAFHAFFDELRGHYLERDRLFQQIELALLCREHVLVVGPPGTAKSELASSVLRRIVDERTQEPSVFAKQIAETTVQTDLIGPVDFKVLTETGRTEHLTEDGMLGAVHGFLDEVFDGRDMLLRSLLNVLHERELKSGTKVVTGRIECAIMTSNRYLSEVLQRSPELLLAFSDRVAFICFVPKGFARRESRARMLDRVAGRQRASFQQRLTIQDLDVLQEAAEGVEVPGAVLDAVERLTEKFEQKLAARAQEDPAFVPAKYLSSRTLVKAVKVLRAAVVLDAIAVPRPTPLRVALADLSLLESFLALGGPLTADRAALLAAAVDPRERVQLEAADAEAWAFAESLAEALVEVEGGDAREAQVLDVETEARNAQGLARKFQPDAVAASATSIARKLATPPRHGKNADALASALQVLSEATARELASRIPESRRLVQTLKAAGAVAEAGRFVASVAVSRKALTEAAVGAVALHLAALADREEAREFEPGGALDLSSLGKDALALLQGIRALGEETTRLLGALDVPPARLRALGEKERETRARCAAVLSRRATSLYSQRLSAVEKGALAQLTSDAERLSAADEVIRELDPSAVPLRTALLGKRAQEYLWGVLGEKRATSVRQLHEDFSRGCKKLSASGVSPAAAIRGLKWVIEERIGDVAAACARRAAEPVPLPEHEVYAIYRERFPGTASVDELGALEALDAFLAAESGASGAFLDPAIGKAFAAAELSLVSAKTEYLWVWFRSVRAGLPEDPRVLKDLTAARLAHERLASSGLPRLVYRDREVSTLLSILEGLRGLDAAQQAQLAKRKQALESLAAEFGSAARGLLTRKAELELEAGVV
jgi:MoxR-like ATPase